MTPEDIDAALDELCKEKRLMRIGLALCDLVRDAHGEGWVSGALAGPRSEKDDWLESDVRQQLTELQAALEENI